MDALIWVVDFGSQYTQLILRRVRELQYSAKIMKVDEALKCMNEHGKKPKCLILSGGPGTVQNEDLEVYSPFFKSEIPVLGICFGHQLMAAYFGGRVEKGQKGEYGATEIQLTLNLPLLNIPKRLSTWMAHFDEVLKVPPMFETVMMSEGGVVAAMRHRQFSQWGLQFHPEVEHTEHGTEILSYFLSQVAHLEEDWLEDRLYEECLHQIESLPEGPILCAFSGGVDSLVAASLVHKVRPKNLHCFFVDHGLLRPQDYHHIQELKKNSHLHIEIINAQAIFLTKLKGVSDPEEKRKIIGHTFIEVFEQKIKEYEEKKNFRFQYLLQGTLYPDVIESSGDGMKAQTIKSHHNVGGLPEKMQLKLMEPLRTLFKDEVRNLGKKLQLKHEWLWRHPFPGPGLAVRVLGEIEEESLRLAQMSDQILWEELNNFELYNHTWQAFTVVLPIQSVGVKGDERAYEKVIAVRCVNAQDGMTAKVSEFPFSFLKKVASRLTNEIPGVGRVVYDITSKPPATIEWE